MLYYCKLLFPCFDFWLANSELAKASLNYNKKVKEGSVNKQSILLLFKKTRVASAMLSISASG